ncbi:MAG TPA: primosomal protein N', partial [Flavobacteriales bacterium]|nr:primosomal protein N' [Flavobacteriales bacterium]
MYAELILPLAAPGTFTYSIPGNLQSEIQAGKRVVVSFGRGKKLFTALVIRTTEEKCELETKDILDCLDDEPILGEKSIEFWNWMSQYYMCSIGEVMSAALPGIMNLTSETSLSVNDKSGFNYSDLDQKSRMLIDILDKNPGINISELARFIGKSFGIKKLKELVDSQIVVGQEELSEKYKVKKSEWISLSDEVKSNVNLDDVILKLSRAPKQLEALMHFIEMSGWDGERFDSEILKKSDFMKSCRISPAVMRGLIERGIFAVEWRNESRINTGTSSEVHPPKTLNDLQLRILEQINRQFEEKNVVLLQGVTSSGKTEIYVQLIEKYLEAGKQVLYLVPEIALTKQLIQRLTHYFGNNIGIYHSRLSQQERVEVWKKVNGSASDRLSIVLGARSAVFLPFRELGLVVIDEEHDRSYKQQDPAPRYMARDSAIL